MFNQTDLGSKRPFRHSLTRSWKPPAQQIQSPCNPGTPQVHVGECCKPAQRHTAHTKHVAHKHARTRTRAPNTDTQTHTHRQTNKHPPTHPRTQARRAGRTQTQTKRQSQKHKQHTHTQNQTHAHKTHKNSAIEIIWNRRHNMTIFASNTVTAGLKTFDNNMHRGERRHASKLREPPKPRPEISCQLRVLSYLPHVQ